MNTHDIKLPPLPGDQGLQDPFIKRSLEAYARAAIDAYRQRGGGLVASEAYDKIDHYLRNNLYDDDYAEYSEALNAVYCGPQPAEPVKEVSDAPAALRFAAQVVELYDDATMDNDYMIDSGDCAGILSALADYFSRFNTTPPADGQAQQNAACVAPTSDKPASGAQNAIHATQPQQIPKGYKRVPIEPTLSMIAAARLHHEGEAYLPVGLYKAMLEAAPEVKP